MKSRFGTTFWMPLLAGVGIVITILLVAQVLTGFLG